MRFIEQVLVAREKSDKQRLTRNNTVRMVNLKQKNEWKRKIQTSRNLGLSNKEKKRSPTCKYTNDINLHFSKINQ